eukprot:comp21750_c0_seq1/m.30810 comp21750_c0_seq1/g.30810  ORF comp21750_c0_seq1/g.30810 comp21750_c0_seq1/m.30810 type:complete len:327 (-) comp21750_c0_seq1:1009-1989(-)
MQHLVCSESPFLASPTSHGCEDLYTAPYTYDVNDHTLLDTPFGYQEETLTYMLADQHKFRARPDYLQSVQNDSIKAWMRQQLIEWIIEVSTAYKSTCVSLAVNLLDRYLSVVKVTPNRLQCVGAAAMLIASKLRDEYPLRSAVIAECADGAFTEEHVKTQEHLILAQLGWTLQAVTADELLEQSLGYLNFSGPSMARLREYALTLLDICHVGYEYLSYEPSVMAAGSLLLGLEMLGYHEVGAVAEALLRRMAITWTRFQECQELMRRHFQQLVAEQGASDSSVVATAAKNYAMTSQKQDDRTSPVSVMDAQDVFQSTMDLDSYRSA